MTELNAVDTIDALIAARLLSQDLPAVVSIRAFAATLDGLDELHPDYVRAELADIVRHLIGDPHAHTRPGPHGWIVHRGQGQIDGGQDNWLKYSGPTEGAAWLSTLRGVAAYRRAGREEAVPCTTCSGGGRLRQWMVDDEWEDCPDCAGLGFR